MGALPKKDIQESEDVKDDIKEEIKKVRKDLEGTLKIDYDEFDIESDVHKRDLDEDKDAKLLEIMKDPKSKIKISINDVIEDFSAQHIYDLLNGSRKIDEIIIEQVKLDEASRTRLKIDPESFKDNMVEEFFLNEKIKHLKKEEILKLGERVLNNSFFSTGTEDVIESGYDGDSSGGEVIHLFDKTNSKKEISSSEVSPMVIDKLGKDNPDKDYTNVGGITFNRHKIKRRVTKRNSEKNFYKAVNHSDLFKIGQSYLADFVNNKNAFAFTSMDEKIHIEKTLFGISSYFNFHCQTKVTIFTTKLEKSFLAENFKDLKTELVQIPALNIQFKCMSSDIVEILEFETLVELKTVCEDFHLDELIDWYITNSDVVLFNIPNLEQLNKQRDLFFPIVNRVSNISFVISEEESKLKDIEKMINFYENYGVDIKGALIKKKSVGSH